MKLLLAFLLSATLVHAQVQRTVVPLGDVLEKALQASVLTQKGAKPFHLRIDVSEPENPKSPYTGTVEEWWASPDQWRREVTDSAGLHQTIVFRDGKRSERDEGDYYPLWLRAFVISALELVPDAERWRSSGLEIEQITVPDGRKSVPCVRTQANVGVGDRASTSYTNLCFDGEGRVQGFFSPRFGMEFHDYRAFEKRQYPRKLVENPEPGTSLVGIVDVLEPLKKVNNLQDLFTPIPEDGTRFSTRSITSQRMQELSQGSGPIVWPPVRSGNLSGHVAMYVSTDSEGHVREAWPLNSDNAGLEDPARAQVEKWTIGQREESDGKNTQLDGPLSFTFTTTTADPLPQLDDAEVRALATHIVEPQWSLASLPAGEKFEVQVSVNEQGKLTGTGFRKVPSQAVGILKVALSQWTFHPLLRDGKPEYFHGTLQFKVPN